MSIFVFYSYSDHRDLHVVPHSFPTRRSSYRPRRVRVVADRPQSYRVVDDRHVRHHLATEAGIGVLRLRSARLHRETERRRVRRSEEHTSELQSLMRISYAVFCLKKKTRHKITKSAKRTYIRQYTERQHNKTRDRKRQY